jgi:hypothetical protein
MHCLHSLLQVSDQFGSLGQSNLQGLILLAQLKQFFSLRQEATFLGLLSFDKSVAALNRE